MGRQSISQTEHAWDTIIDDSDDLTTGWSINQMIRGANIPTNTVDTTQVNSQKVLVKNQVDNKGYETAFSSSVYAEVKFSKFCGSLMTPNVYTLYGNTFWSL